MKCENLLLHYGVQLTRTLFLHVIGLIWHVVLALGLYKVVYCHKCFLSSL